MNNRQVAEALAEAIRTDDMAVFADIHAENVVVSYPQSGEIFNGIEDLLAMLANYPGGLAHAEISNVLGDGEKVHVASPLPFGMPVVTVTGAGENFVLEGVADYGEGGLFNVVILVAIRGGRITDESWYFAEQFDPPSWRKRFTA